MASQIQPSVSRALPVLGSVDEALAAAQALAADLRDCNVATEENRLLDPAIVAKIRNAGLFGIMGAKAFGGSEVGVEALVRVTIEIATNCPSAGWVYGVLAGHSWMLNLFPPKAQEEVAGSANNLAATVFRLGGEARKVDGGIEIRGGHGRFSSGIDHAGWLIGGTTVTCEDGTPKQYFLLLPRSEILVIDDWHTLGMRGTGSRSVEIESAFVPDYRAVALTDMIAGQAPGALFHKRPFYRMGFTDVTGYAIAGAPLGMARAALNCFADDLARELAKTGERAYQGAAFVRLGRAAAQIDAAIALVVADAAKIDRLADPAYFSELDRKELTRNMAWAAQACRAAVNDLYEIAGGTTIYNFSAFQRIWRDVNSAAQHFGFTQDKAEIDYARARLGLNPIEFVLGKAKRNPS